MATDEQMKKGPETSDEELKVVEEKLKGLGETLEREAQEQTLWARVNGLCNWAAEMSKRFQSLVDKLDLLIEASDRDREARFKHEAARYEKEFEDGLAYSLFKEAWLLAIKGDDFAMDMTKGQSEIIAKRSLTAAEAFVEKRAENRKAREGKRDEG